MRVGTGLLLVIWGLIKVAKPEAAVGVSDKYYHGIVSIEALQMPWGIAQVVIGLAVVLGLMRKIVYPAQAIILGVGLLAIWNYILDPLGLYLLDKETANILFFPSIAVFAGTLVLMAFGGDDTIRYSPSGSRI
jgi:FtsH-binding integral membrane protein